jgi:hypothetical protein
MFEKMRTEQVEILMRRAVSNLVRSGRLVHGISLYRSARVLIAFGSVTAAWHQDYAAHPEAAQFADEPMKINFSTTDLIG